MVFNSSGDRDGKMKIRMSQRCRKKHFMNRIMGIILTVTIIGAKADLPKVMLTGYWNPTGKMIAEFCTDPRLNPSGWKGANWEGMGFDLYSFFPEPGTYTGWFEVDYQDTWKDFWKLTDSLHPAAIISFGANHIETWEIEYNARNITRWLNDREYPYKPTPNPPDSTVAVNHKRNSTLPVQAIADAVKNQTPIKEAWIDWNGNPQRYLCEYIAYLGMWYQDQHSATNDPYHCQMAGFIHVGDSIITYAEAKEAALVSIRTVIKSLTVTGNLAESIDNRIQVFLKKSRHPNKNAWTFNVNLPQAQQIKLSLRDIKGREITTVYNGYKHTGKHLIEFNHFPLVSGIYFCTLETAKNGMFRKKISVIK